MTTEATVNVSVLRLRPRRAGTRLLLLAGLALATSCASDTVREGRGGSYLILQALEASRGGTDEPFSTVLQSDVVTGGGVFEDPGRVSLRLALKDIGTPTSPTAPNSNNVITVSRYRVVFRRSDGRNTPGVDVPYAFDGAATFTVGETGATTAAFTIVRAQAKLEAPLISLAGGGGALVISTLADVTFYGRDQAGNDVSVTGTISVNFADWADPK